MDYNVPSRNGLEAKQIFFLLFFSLRCRTILLFLPLIYFFTTPRELTTNNVGVYASNQALKIVISLDTPKTWAQKNLLKCPLPNVNCPLIS